MADLEQAGLDAVDRFINTWNSRDPVQWAASLHYPHVRPSPSGPITVFNNAEDYAAGADFQSVIDSGWDHSEWDYRQVLHTGANKIHVAGQWSRYTADGAVILTTPVVYVCTHIEGAWGIQSRFGADHVDEDTDTTELQSRGLNLIQDFLNHLRGGNREACAELLNYPHFSVGIGKLGRTDSAAAFEMTNTELSLISLVALQTGLHSMNATVELDATLDSRQRRLQGVVHINDRDGHLGIQAWSLLEPDEVGG